MPDKDVLVVLVSNLVGGGATPKEEAQSLFALVGVWDPAVGSDSFSHGGHVKPRVVDWTNRLVC
jgi:hypothetical protein